MIHEENSFQHGDIVPVKIIDHRIQQMATGTWGLHLRFLHNEKGEIDGYVWLTPKCAGQIRAFLRTVELDPDTFDVSRLDPEHENGVSLLEKEVWIECAEEVYRGESRIKVAHITPPRKSIKESKKFFGDLNAVIRGAKNRDKDAEEKECPF